MAATSLDDLYVDLQRIVSLASGVPLSRTILAEQGRPAPEPEDELYATYNPIPVRAVGQPRQELSLVDATEDFNETLLGADWQDFEQTVISQLELMVSINFFNDGARDSAWRMHNANHSWSVTDALWAAEIGWRYCSDVRNMTDLLQAGLQQRYQVDLNLYVETAIVDNVLRAAGFSVTIEDEAGNIVSDWSA